MFNGIRANSPGPKSIHRLRTREGTVVTRVHHGNASKLPAHSQAPTAVSSPTSAAPVPRLRASSPADVGGAEHRGPVQGKRLESKVTPSASPLGDHALAALRLILEFEPCLNAVPFHPKAYRAPASKYLAALAAVVKKVGDCGNDESALKIARAELLAAKSEIELFQISRAAPVYADYLPPTGESGHQRGHIYGHVVSARSPTDYEVAAPSTFNLNKAGLCNVELALAHVDFGLYLQLAREINRLIPGYLPTQGCVGQAA